MKAIWNDQVIAVSDDIVMVEGNPYFPTDSLNRDFLVPSEKKTRCPWKGEASYYSIRVGDQTNADAAWYYAAPKPSASDIAGRVAFWRGVNVVP